MPRAILARWDKTASVLNNPVSRQVFQKGRGRRFQWRVMMSSREVSVRFTGNTAELDASITSAKNVLKQFGDSTAGINLSLQRLNATMDANTQSIKVNNDVLGVNVVKWAAVAYGISQVRQVLKEFGDAQIATSANILGTTWSYELKGAKFALEEVAQGAVAVGQAIKTNFVAAEGATQRFAVANGFLLRTFKDESGIMAISAMGGLQAFSNQVALTATDVRVHMRQIQADMAKALHDEPERLPTLDVMPMGSAALPTRQESDAMFAQQDELEKAGASIRGADDILKAFLDDLQEIPDISRDAAMAIEAGFTTIPQYTLEANQAMIDLTKASADSAEEAKVFGKNLVDALKDSEHGGARVAEMLNKIGDADQRIGTAQNLARSMDPRQAVVMFETIRNGLAAQKAGIEANDAVYLSNQNRLNAIGRLIEGIVGNTKAEHLARLSTIETLGQENTLLEEQARLWGEIAKRAEEQKAFVAAIAATNTPTGRIDDLTRTRTALESRPQRTVAEGGGVTQEQLILAAKVAYLEARGEPDKGQEAVIDVFRNRLAQGSFGPDLTSVLMAKGQFANDPNALAGVDIQSEAFLKMLDKVERAFDAKNPSADVTGGATHFINPQTATDRSWVDQMTNVSEGQAFGQHRFGNVGTDPVHSDDVEIRRREGIAEVNTALLEQNNIQAGGTAIERANLDIAQQRANGLKDQVDQARQLVAASEQAVTANANGTPEARLKADQDLATAKSDLLAKEIAETDAANKLEVLSTEQGSFARAAVENKYLADKLEGLRQGSAEYSTILAQMVANTKAAAQQEERDQSSAARAVYENKKVQIEAQMADVKAAQAEGLMSGQQALARTIELNAQLAAADRAYQQTRSQIFGAETTEFRQAKAAEAVIAQQLRAKDEAAVREHVKQIEQSYKAAFESVGSTISSSLMSIIERTGTMRQLMQNVARNITQQFLDAGIKIAADWAAHQALMGVQTVLGQAT